jgi:hypothetical protein
MTEIPERRQGRRVVVPGRPGGRVRATLDARLLDLSGYGARNEHHELLRPGFACTLELPLAIGGLVLPVRVVRSIVVGTQDHPTGDRLLRYESGLTFVYLTGEQHEALEALRLARAPLGAPDTGRPNVEAKVG